MSSKTCWRCLARAPMKTKGISFIHDLRVLEPNVQQIVAFSTISLRSNVTPQGKVKKGLRPGVPPKRGTREAPVQKRKRVPESKGRPPAPGERKALRKRIVLSNTNALEVIGMENVSAELLKNEGLQGQILGIPGILVDQLRAVEAFKLSQGWGLFRRPGMLFRKETLQYGQLFDELGEKKDETVRKILVGERGSGKSMMLLQAMTIAFLKKWVVISIPEGTDLVNGHTDYAPLPGSSPLQYIQKSYTAKLLSTMVKANPMLSTLQFSGAHQHNLPMPVQENISLQQLALLGAADPEVAWPVFTAMWTELTTPSSDTHPRPKILITMDGLGHVMKPSAYKSPQFTPIHAHQFTLVKWFMNYLSGSLTLPNGGMVVAAMSESNHPTVPTLLLKLAQLEARQTMSRPNSPLSTTTLMQPFLDATAQSHDPIPQADPFTKYDQHVMDVFNAKGNQIEIQRLKGLSKEEARGLMEYWAKSGVMRQTISEGLVSEKWSISGGGVVGELERGCIRMRM